MIFSLKPYLHNIIFMTKSLIENKEKWIDVYKGIAIIMVPLAHILPTFRFLYIFHMPLFFFLSGFTFHNTAVKTFFLKKTNRLLIPHFIYFIIISVISVLIPSQHNQEFRIILKNYLWDTTSLVYDYGTFWFIPVLFLSLLCLKIISRKLNNVETKYLITILLLLYITAFICSRLSIRIFQGIQNIPFALFYLVSGYLTAKFLNTPPIINSIKDKLLHIMFFLLFITLLIYCPNKYYIDMKHAQLGVPFLSMLLSFVAIYLIIVLSNTLSKYDAFYSFFKIIGDASIAIMYLHQFIHFRLLNIIPLYVIVVIAIIIPCVFHYLNKIIIRDVFRK